MNSARCSLFLGVVILVFSFVEWNSRGIILAAGGILVIRSIIMLLNGGVCPFGACKSTVSDKTGQKLFIVKDQTIKSKPSKQEVEETLNKKKVKK